MRMSREDIYVKLSCFHVIFSKGIVGFSNMSLIETCVGKGTLQNGFANLYCYKWLL